MTMMKTVQILGENMTMKADPSAAHSIICEKEFKNLKAHRKVVFEAADTQLVTRTR